MNTQKLRTLVCGLCVIGMLICFSSMSFAGGGKEKEVEAAELESIVRYSSDWPLNLDPARASYIENLTVMVNLFDPLVFPDSKGNPQPHVAESWEVSSDGLTWTFHIQKGIKFHDGSALTAEDVKFSMDRSLTIGEGTSHMWYGKIIKTTLVDDYTVKFEMEKPLGTLLATLPYLFIANKDAIMNNLEKPGTYGDMGDYGKGYASLNDVGSGPYRVKDFRYDESLLLEKNPDYFLNIDSAPQFFKQIGSTEPSLVKTLFARRELEMCNMWHSLEALESFSKIDGVEAVSWPTNAEAYITMHTRKPPLDDIHVRKALAWAFDYEAAVSLVPGAVQSKGPVPQSVPGSDPNAFQYQQDLEKAKAELKKSKYYGELDAYPIECRWHDNVEQQKQAMLIMSNANEIGLTVNVVESTWGQLEEDSSSQETEPHMHVVGDEAAYPEAGPLLEGRYHSITAATWEQSEWLLDPVLDKMIEESYTIIDREKRFAKYREISKYIMDLCPTIFVLDKPQNRAYQAAYMNWPSARGEAIPYMAYSNAARLITVYPEKREELLK